MCRLPSANWEIRRFIQEFIYYLIKLYCVFVSYLNLHKETEYVVLTLSSERHNYKLNYHRYFHSVTNFVAANHAPVSRS
jgi:hypothetical protein